MKRRAAELTALLMVLGFLGLLVMASGIVPVRASDGHWGITRAVLSFASRRSVETHAIGTRVPDLEESALIVRGAGHYDRGCQPCHGAPGEPSSLVARALTPTPPYLPEVVPRWTPAELFQIVRHGLKMTGMPAWPAVGRDDEVWAVVAFLRRLPELDAVEYQHLTWGDVSRQDGPRQRGPRQGGTGEVSGAPGLMAAGEQPPQLTRVCAQCHGEDGMGRGVGAVPRIAGQSPAYLEASLSAYATGARPSGIMGSVAAGLDELAIRELARWYARTGSSVAGTGERVGAVSDRADHPPDLVALGERIARLGVPRRKVPSCTECHGPGDAPRNARYPSLAGQYAGYLELQLRLFREDRRGGSDYAHIMREVVHALEAEEAVAVAAWYASLPWAVNAPREAP